VEEEVIAVVSCVLALYEAFALATKRPTVTVLSARWPLGFLVWAWLAWLAVHFIGERRSHGHVSY
jgi:hypothetical protein